MAASTHNDKPHAEDALIAGYIRDAVSFSAFLRTGPLDKHTRNGLASYDEARTAADALEAAHSRFGRKAMVYAVTKEGYTIACTEKAVERARAL